MIVIVGLVILLIAVIVGFTGVLTNAGAANPLTENFSVFGYHVTGSTGTLFLFGIVVGAVAMLGLSVLLGGAGRTAGRGRDARRELQWFRRETALVNRDREQLLEQQNGGTATGSPVNPQGATARRNTLLGRWSRRRLPTRTPVDSPGRAPNPVHVVSRIRGWSSTRNEGTANEHR